ncbi:hypothetical protein UFOVP26_8 [uncultured Caudovirales phage]|uniref:ASCH domain containing protein n=1 Tax=uncultured Caudovirales phage TaxID=2100421 RepID=A0A6J5KK70_9CAUD|nr:hypothetical protein UFOVP26_8 [uncultured Caudovirales phage]CAB4123921.1 hypothetical protein UFOVP44_89 [uncultured Caudovirales phage]CAB5219426.1 hypothetical protein UFOVP220_80 [uncultured Caudovirales phage]
MYVIGFVPPLVGLEGHYNTFRIGGKWFKTLTVGERVAIMDEKNKKIVSYAEVTELHKGQLSEMLEKFAYKNHTGLGAIDLGKFILKLYGPHIVNDTKLTTVICLRKLEDGLGLKATDI